LTQPPNRVKYYHSLKRSDNYHKIRYMQVKPLGNRVLIKLAKKDEITKSGIVLPPSADKQEKTKGDIIAVGPGKLLENGNFATPEVSVGQSVLVKSWGGDEVEMDGEEYKIFDAEDILAILE